MTKSLGKIRYFIDVIKDKIQMDNSLKIERGEQLMGAVAGA